MGRPVRPAIRFEDLPLFASDDALAEAVVGRDPHKIACWIASLDFLEGLGFPAKHPAYGRYTPAVKRFYDREYAQEGAPPPETPNHPREDLSRWTESRTRRRKGVHRPQA